MTDYKALLDELRARQADIVSEYEALDTAIKAMEHLAGEADVSSPSTMTFEGLSMPQAVIKVLGATSEPLPTAQIKAAIINGGMKGGTNIGSHIYNTLHRLSQEGGPIRRWENGRWSLRATPKTDDK